MDWGSFIKCWNKEKSYRWPSTALENNFLKGGVLVGLAFCSLFNPKGGSNAAAAIPDPNFYSLVQEA